MSEEVKDSQKAPKKKRDHHLWNEFKAFISRGSVIDMAVGVVIGGAFGAIVTAVVNILLSLCTWGVPGGINGLVTVLPPLNDVQRGIAFGITGVNASGAFAASDLNSVVTAFGSANGWNNTEALSIISSNYTKIGANYYANTAALINWGALINAIISFIIIAITLFIILKIFHTLQKKRLEFKAAEQERYYQKHPEERPVPPEPGKPSPTEVELLTQINEQLAKLNESKTAKPAAKK